ncbi:uncharacterized protein [Ptychodera flava]|uniref:uncharacterized protein isoform X1 n=1 Tax=Ptychodera flava TaxID=63121 RepID=UPI00396A0672
MWNVEGTRIKRLTTDLLQILYQSDSRSLTEAVRPIVIGYWSDNQVKSNMVTIPSSIAKQIHSVWLCKQPTLNRDGGVVINAVQKPMELREFFINIFTFLRQWVLAVAQSSSAFSSPITESNF